MTRPTSTNSSERDKYLVQGMAIAVAMVCRYDPRVDELIRWCGLDAKTMKRAGVEAYDRNQILATRKAEKMDAK